MTTAVRWTMAWTCYWAGHVTYLVVERGHDYLPERWQNADGVIIDFGYRLYVRLMVWSDWWQGETTYGPWMPADDSF